MSEIKKIVLEINGKEIELSIDEAKELQEMLGDLFGEQKYINVPQPYPVAQPYPVYPTPPIYPQPYYTPWRQWQTDYYPNFTSGTTVTFSTTSTSSRDDDFGSLIDSLT